MKHYSLLATTILVHDMNTGRSVLMEPFGFGDISHKLTAPHRGDYTRADAEAVIEMGNERERRGLILRKAPPGFLAHLYAHTDDTIPGPGEAITWAELRECRREPQVLSGCAVRAEIQRRRR